MKLTTRKKDGKPILHYWISKAQDQTYVRFISFWLNCYPINLDINTVHNEVTALQKILKNDNIPYPKKLILDLLKREYKLKESDEEIIYQYFEDDLEAQKFITLCRLTYQSPIYISANDIFQESKIILIFESIKQNEVIGFRYSQNKWSQFINNAIINYKEFWHLIESALKNYNRWDKTLNNDKNGTFKRKVKKIKSQKLEKRHDLDSLVNAIYPEIT